MCAFSTINILNSTELIQLNMEADLLSCTSVLFVAVLLLVQSVWELLQRGCWCSSAVQWLAPAEGSSSVAPNPSSGTRQTLANNRGVAVQEKHFALCLKCLLKGHPSKTNLDIL